MKPDHSELVRRGLVPYIVKWSTETETPFEVHLHPRRGISYADEALADRDRNGILWTRGASRPGHGRPLFGEIHPLRQRRAMRKLLCQVCGRPADQDADGTLWVLKDHRDDWPGWPHRMAVTEPPICRPCAQVSTRNCPALRRGSVTIRVRASSVAGILGVRYHPTLDPAPTPDIVPLTDPTIRWIRATQLAREIHHATIT